MYHRLWRWGAFCMVMNHEVSPNPKQFMLFQDIHFSPFPHLNKSRTRMAKSSPGYLEQIHLTGWWLPGHKESSEDVVTQQGAMFAHELKPRLRIWISQTVGSPLFGSVFYIPTDAILEPCTRSISHNERKKTWNTFVADSSCALAILLLHNCLERVIDLHSHVMFTIRSRGMVAKTTQPQNQSARPGCKNTSISIHTVSVRWVC